MSTRRFRRHAPPCLDGAIHHIFDTLAGRPALRGAFTRLLTMAHARSDLLRALPPSRNGRYIQLDALRNLAGYHRQFTGDPFAWNGAPGRHPLGIIDSLARHLLGRYPTPRFLASVWFGGDGDEERQRRQWYIDHSRGRRFRDLRLPVAMTRRMEHVLLRSPDHLDVHRALRRAEVIGLGGSPALADAITATRLGTQFDRPALWRTVLAWLVACGDEADLAWVKPIVDDIHATTPPPLLTGRSFEVMRREVDARRPRWQGQPLQRPRLHTRPPLTWPRSPWSEAMFIDDDAHWRVIELTDSSQLAQEGRAMHHCVAGYAPRCARGTSRIWSLRQTSLDGNDVPVLTIEIEPRSATIVQLRGRHNRRAAGKPLAMVRRWAARERLGVAAAVEAWLATPELAMQMPVP